MSVSYVNNNFFFKIKENCSVKSLFFKVVSVSGTVSEICPLEDGGFLVCNIEGVELPILSVSLFERSDKGNCLLESLDKLFYFDDKEYERHFIRKVQRQSNASIQYFIASQLSLFFYGETAYKCSSAVVMGYKAVEIGDDFLLISAKDSVMRSLSLISDCKTDWHPRRNSEHLKYSLLCVAYHIAISQKDRLFLEEVVDKVVSEFDSLLNFFTPSYPIGLTLLLGVLIGLKRGDDLERGEALVKCLELLFKNAVRDSKIEKLTLFEELGVTHKSTVLAKKVLQDKASSKDILQHVLRVKGKRLEMLSSNFEVMYEK